MMSKRKLSTLDSWLNNKASQGVQDKVQAGEQNDSNFVSPATGKTKLEELDSWHLKQTKLKMF